MRKLADLPQFLITGIERSETNIQFMGKINVPSAYSGDAWLYRSGTTSIIGTLIVNNSDGGSDTFNASREYLIDEPTIGQRLPVIEARWDARQVAMIVNEDNLWKHVHFKPSDAINFKSPEVSEGWIATQKAENTEIPPGSKFIGVVPNGWDHEHCDLCWKKIGIGGDDCGYVYDDKQWLCEACYLTYAEKHDLSFLGEWTP